MNGWIRSKEQCNLARVERHLPGRNLLGLAWRQAAHGPDPGGELTGYVRPGRRCHPATEGVDVVAPEAAGCFRWGCVRVGSDIPYRPECNRMNVPDIGNGDQVPALPTVRGEGLGVDPSRGLTVVGDFQVVLELLGADGAAGVQHHLDLPQDQGVALYRGGVVRLQMSDVIPDPCRFDRRRQATQPGQIGCGGLEAGVYIGPTRSSAWRHPAPDLSQWLAG